MSTHTTFNAYRCACGHEWDQAVTYDSGSRWEPPEHDGPSECPRCGSDEIEKTDASYDDPNAPDRDED